jgi:prepilin-type N-terminal cleavage/methylation domain-containing protein
MRGMTLIEVAIATALVAVIALGVAPLLAIAVRANAAARLELDATAAATERMEQLLAAPFAAAISPADSLAVDYQDFSDTVASSGGILTRRWCVRPSAFDPDDTRVFSVSVRAAGHPSLATWTTIRTRTAP